jgi:hypothetical protein
MIKINMEQINLIKIILLCTKHNAKIWSPKYVTINFFLDSLVGMYWMMY